MLISNNKFELFFSIFTRKCFRNCGKHISWHFCQRNSKGRTWKFCHNRPKTRQYFETFQRPSTKICHLKFGRKNLRTVLQERYHQVGLHYPVVAIALRYLHPRSSQVSFRRLFGDSWITGRIFSGIP